MPQQPPRRATRADVARLAGVSDSTVSYALTGDRPISDETRERIERAMQELGYVPHARAAALASKKPSLVALHFPVGERGIDVSDLNYVNAASDRAEVDGIQMLMWTHDVTDIEALRRLVTQGLVDGLILMEIRQHDERVEYLKSTRLPFVTIGRTKDNASISYIDADFDSWGPMAVNHLADFGHVEVALVSQPDEVVESGYGPVILTQASLRAQAKRRGMSVHMVNVRANIRAGREALATLLRDHPGITAVIGFNAPAMIGVLEELAVSGLRVPEDVSILHFGISPEQAEMTVPAQTTISAPGGALGEEAMTVLIEKMTSSNPPIRQILTSPVMVDRGSTGPVRPQKG